MYFTKRKTSDGKFIEYQSAGQTKFTVLVADEQRTDLALSSANGDTAVMIDWKHETNSLHLQCLTEDAFTAYHPI